MDSHQQGKVEGRRKKVETNQICSIHHLGKYWDKFLSPLSSGLYENVFHSQCIELETLRTSQDHGSRGE